MRLRDRINQDLTRAMKSRESERLAVLRMMKTAVKNREIEERAELEDAQAIQILSTLIKQRKESIEQFVKGGRNDLAEKESAEIRVIEEYLPAALSEDAIARVVDEVILATGASSIQDLGAVMKECMARFSGSLVDGRKVNAAVRSRLEGR